MYKLVIRPFLFLLSPERAHYFVFSALKVLFRIPFVKPLFRQYYSVNDPRLHRKIAGIYFPNPVGLAAGFDKNANYIDILSTLGFGFVETGTVTPLPQPGNEQRRLFRLPEDEALINRMGFNNDGADVIAERLKRRKSSIIIGGNIGKNKATPNENAVNDYVICFKKLFDCVDYFVVNVSSPNTPGLRELQDKKPLTRILSRLQEINNSKQKPKPIFLKIAPDLTKEQLDDIIEIVIETKIAGVIATNTTLSREGLKTSQKKLEEVGNGGLSGKPLAKRSTEIIRYLSEKSRKSFSIIGVGGIHAPGDAMDKINAGADLVQLYTGFIYEGPSLIKNINKEIR